MKKTNFSPTRTGTTRWLCMCLEGRIVIVADETIH
jgi:hypothetical protein